jgi:hypothetical protein
MSARPLIAVSAALAGCLLTACGASSHNSAARSSNYTSTTSSSTTGVRTSSSPATTSGSATGGSGTGGSATGGSGGRVSASITLPSGTVVRLTSGTVTCTMPGTGIIDISAEGQGTSGQDVKISAGVEGYTGPGTYNFASEGPLGGVSVGSSDRGMMSDGTLDISSNGSAVLSGHWVDDAAAALSNPSGSIQANLSWPSCPST